MQVKECGDALQQRGLAPPMIELVQLFPLAGLDMLGQCVHGSLAVLLGYRIQYSLMILADRFQLRGIVTAPFEREDPDQQPGLVHDFLDPLVLRQAHQ
jgi:hypothetical protein